MVSMQIYDMIERYFPHGLVVVELVFCLFIVQNFTYTVIDWPAYMQEVQGFLDGERNYLNIEGDTGPLVYPAGFVYVFSVLKWMTENGENVRIAQYIFAGLSVVLLSVVLSLYRIGNRVHLWTGIALVLSKRMHSIFVLRLFNDCVAIFFGYLAILFFTKSQWRIGSLIYSFAVSVKMNLFLYAPGVLLVLWLGTGLTETIICLCICAGLQVLLGLPFLLQYPVEYISKAFEFSRVFEYKWTVNYAFLEEAVFVGKPLSYSLLLLTVLTFVFFAVKAIKTNRAILVERNFSWFSTSCKGIALSPHFIIMTIFTSNFIGVVFARTLHYQFYCWYFHTLPYLLWCSNLHIILQISCLICIEIAFNVFPATTSSSLLLQGSHFVILAALAYAPYPKLVITEENDKKDNVEKNKSI